MNITIVNPSIRAAVGLVGARRGGAEIGEAPGKRVIAEINSSGQELQSACLPVVDACIQQGPAGLR